MQVLRLNFENIKNTFLALSVDSNYPNIGTNQMNIWFNNCQFQDFSLNLAALDNIVVAAEVKTDMTKHIKISHGDLMRFEFMEVIVRITM